MHIPPHLLRARFALSLARMYGREVPAYDLLVEETRAVNAAVAGADPAYADSLGSLDRISAERHGAIRVGSPQELAWIARLFALLGMHPVGFYDLREAAASSAVPMIATAFRPVAADELARNPFRVFTSMLVTDDRRFFHDQTLRQQVEAAIASRQMFKPELRLLIARSEQAGGVDGALMDAFLTAATEAFALPAHAVDQALYDAVFKVSPVAADIYFGLNINHLTPRVLDIDAAAKGMEARNIRMKDQVEGPPKRAGVEVLLRQTSFRSLPEPIRFRRPNGEVVEGTRKVRFGEIEQRGVALTPAGRKIYDDALDAFEAQWAADSTGDYQQKWRTLFDAVMPATYAELAEQNLAYFTYHTTPQGVALGVRVAGKTRHELVRLGYLTRRPIVYEDFLPKSAAGIFISNLGDDHGTRHAEEKGSDAGIHTLAGAMGRAPLDPYNLYGANEQASWVSAMAELGLATS